MLSHFKEENTPKKEMREKNCDMNILEEGALKKPLNIENKTQDEKKHGKQYTKYQMKIF